MSRIVETYRRVPDGFAFFLAAVASWCLATIAGIAGGFAATYLYDHGNSKGDDIAVLASGLLAVGTFAFVVLFTGLRKLHREISSQTPLSACLFCFTGSLLITAWVWPNGDLDHYLKFILAGWLAILLFGLAGLLLSRRLFVHSPH
jgi:drug/metabolite transporter (DMT)-like permease